VKGAERGGEERRKVEETETKRDSWWISGEGSKTEEDCS